MPVAQQALDRLVAGFIHRDQDAALEFRRVAPPIIRGLARRFGPDLPADVVDEVVSETCLLLLGRTGTAFDASRGSAQKFLFGVVANAVKNVRAGYCPPGALTRQHKNRPKIEPVVVSFEESQHGLEQRMLPDVRQVDAAADVAALLSGLTAVLAMGVSRFKIRRAMRELQLKAASTSAAEPVLHP